MSGSFRRSERLAARRRRVKTKPQPQPRLRPRKQKKRGTTARSPNLPQAGIMDLPAELRHMIVRNLIHVAKGPEVYVGKGFRVPAPMNHLHYTRAELQHFRSSVTGAIEVCVAILELDTSLLETWRNAANCRLTDHSGYPHYHGLGQESWVAAYSKLRPLMACKTLYYEATAVFFQEKHFVLGSSTYAHAWLRRIGQRNQVNLRNIRLKIHKELTITGEVNASGSLWIEVLKKLGRSARELRVLGFQSDGHFDLWRSTLLRSFLRMKSFQKLEQIDIYHRYSPRRANSDEFLAMMAASTGCASVRCLEVTDAAGVGHRLIRRAFHDYTGQVQVS